MFLAKRSRSRVPEVNTALACVLRCRLEDKPFKKNVIFLSSLVLKMWAKLLLFLCLVLFFDYGNFPHYSKRQYPTVEQTGKCNTSSSVNWPMTSEMIRNDPLTQLWDISMHTHSYTQVQIVFMLHMSCSAVLWRAVQRVHCQLCSYCRVFFLFSEPRGRFCDNSSRRE